MRRRLASHTRPAVELTRTGHHCTPQALFGIEITRTGQGRTPLFLTLRSDIYWHHIHCLRLSARTGQMRQTIEGNAT
eukprot:3372610-Rhodomonas_salina.2